MRKLILAAGSGYLGQVLVKQLENEFDEFVVLTRGQNNPDSNRDGKVKYVHWDAEHGGEWQKELENAVAVINLAGKNVNCRYTKKNKAEIFSSRLNSTTILGKTISQLKNPPEIWINSASATIYRESFDTPRTENSKEIGEGFSVEVCKAWEKSFFDFKLPDTRMVCLRIGMILGNSGGVFPVLKKLTKLGFGGKMGSGKQMVNWMDEDDFVRLVKWAIDTKTVNGIYNCTAPFPLRNEEYAKIIRTKMKIPFGLPATKWMLEFGAIFLRTETELVLKSRYVIPERALKEGFVFKFPKFENCMDHLLNVSR